MYWHDIYRIKNTIEHEYKFAGRYGAKGEKREKKSKATKEQIAVNNQKQREKRMRRLIAANFEEDDLWCTLKYPAGTRKPIAEVEKDMDRFLDKMRYRYKKVNVPFKFVYRLEIGARGGVHVHFLCNRIEKADVMIKKCWTQGAVFYRGLTGEYEALAAYIVKKPEEDSPENRQLSMFDEEDQKKLLKVSTSRNLVRPEPERRVYMHWTMRKLLEEGPKATEGYYIDKNSVQVYENPVTGYRYMEYTEVKIEKNRKNVRT